MAASTPPTRPTPSSGAGSSDEFAVPDEIAAMGYEQARQELVDIVAQLEGGQVGLEESMTLWQRGEALARHCEQWLQQAEAAIRSATPSSAPPANGSG